MDQHKTIPKEQQMIDNKQQRQRTSREHHKAKKRK